MPIHEGLFAHINNDCHLKGSYDLEGNSFKVTIGFLNEFIEKLGQNSNLPTEVVQLKQAFQQLVIYEEAIRILTNETNAKDELRKISERIFIDCQNLRPGEYLLIPAGWVDSTGGHAVIYQFTLEATGNMLLSIHNSGSGIEFHHKLSSNEKELYNPTLIYRIPQEKSAHKQYFSEVIYSLLEPRIYILHKRSKIDSKYLYQSVISKLHYLNAQIISDKKHIPQHWYTAGQLSGTCAQRSLHQMLKSLFPSLDDYRNFIFSFKAFSLDEYITNLKQQRDFTKAQYSGQIRKAINHQLRLLNAISANNFLSIDIIKQKILHLSNYIKELTPDTTHKQRIPIEINSIASSNINIQAPNIKKVSVPINSHFRTNLLPPKKTQGHGELLTEMGELIKRCQALQNTNQYQTLFEHLEHFFIELPLPNSFKDSLHPFYKIINSVKNAFVFFEKLNKLQELYFTSVDQLLNNTTTLPRIYLMKLSVYTVVGHINEHIKEYFSSKCYRSFLNEVLNPTTVESPDDAYLANQNPNMDARLLKIKELFHSDGITYNYNVDKPIYYQSIVNKFPHLKAILENLYQKEYANDYSAFHQGLREHDVTSVFYLTERFENISQKQDFQPLLERFNLQKEMEYAYTLFSKRTVLNSHNHQNISTPILIKSISDTSIEAQSPFTENSNNFIIVSNAIKRAKFNLPETSTALALSRDLPVNDKNAYMPPKNLPKREDNHTQIIPPKYSHILQFDNLPIDEKHRITNLIIQESDLEDRALFHLRRDKDAQISLTLDYFTKHLEKLARRDMQVYLEANLFQPGLIIQQLKEGKQQAFFQQFNSFIALGVEHFELRKQPSLNSISFIRLAYLIYQYAAKVNHELFQMHLEKFYQQLNVLIEITTNLNIKASLHQYRMLTFTAAYPSTKICLMEGLLSYLFAQTHSNHGEQLDNATRFDFQQAQLKLKRILQSQRSTIKPQPLLEMLVDLGIPYVDPKVYKITGDYPVFEIKDKNKNLKYKLNIEEGLVYRDNLAYSKTPLSICNHPLLLKQLKLFELNTGFISPDSSMFIIERPEVCLRFFKEGNSYQVQKKIDNDLGEVAWYQLAALSEMQRDYLNLPNASILKLTPQLPSVINERDTLAWVHIDSNAVLLMDSQKKPWFHTKETSLYHIPTRSKLTPQGTWLHKKLINFEDDRFIYATVAQNCYTIKLARYNLEFWVPENSQELNFKWNNIIYINQEDKHSLGDNIRSLTFLHNNHEICILPIQEFLATDKRQDNNEYYLLQQDIKGTIPAKSVEHHDKPQLWQYSNSESYMVLNLKDNNPVPQTAAEALYLCYLYLGSHQLEEAWKILEYCDIRIGGFEGTFAELRYLNWICNSLPNVLKNKDKDTTISTPPVVACQLKALALFTAFASQNENIKFPDEVSDSTTINEIYEQYIIKTTHKFYQEINSYIYKLYTRLQAMRRELPINFIMSDMECSQLLNFYYDSLPEGEDRPVGALAFERVQLHLKMLNKEFSNRKHLTRPLTSFEQHRQQEIEEFIEKHEGIAKKYSELEYIPIDLSIPQFATVKSYDLSHNAYMKLLSANPFASARTKTYSTSEVLSTLTPNIEQEEFIKQFPYYLFIATGVNKQETAQIESFCKSTLLAYRHTPLKDQQTNTTLLCNALYRVICSKRTLPNHVMNYYHLLTYVSDITPKPIMVAQLVDKTDSLMIDVKQMWRALHETPLRLKPESPAGENFNIPLFTSQLPFQQDIFLQWTLLAKTFYTGTVVNQELTASNSNNELICGQTRHHALKELKKIAKTNLSNTNILDTLEKLARNRDRELTSEQNDLTKKIMLLANQGPAEQLLQAQWESDISSQKRAPLDMKKLLKLYFHQDINQYQIETGLSVNNANTLHQMIIKFVSRALINKQIARIITKLGFVNSTHDEASHDQALFQLGDTLFSQNLVDVANEPTLSILQYYNNILLRPQQKSVLQRLLTLKQDGNYTELVEKIIMGGGKSKCITPIVAQEKANGNNLVTIEVPRSLLRTNYVDLKASSTQLFGQSPLLFEFNRYFNCTPKSLERLYQQLSDVMVNKNYLVTTGDSLQSLELKYLELLHTMPDTTEKPNENWEKQVLLIEKIVKLFRNHADLLIDEVHQGLCLKNKLNYTIGSPGRVPQSIILNTIKLFKFFDKVLINQLPCINKSTRITLADVVKNNKCLTEPKYFTYVCKELIHQLAFNDSSPLKSLIEEFGSPTSNIRQQLKFYLNDECTSVPEFILNASQQTKEFLALYKEQVSHILLFTLKRKHGEHYGPSKLASRAPAMRAVAIPYIANNVPNERSLFGNYLETLNYTIQSMLISGVGSELMSHFLNNLVTQARKEMQLNYIPDIDDTPSAKLFNTLAERINLRLSMLDLDDETQFRKLHTSLSHNEDLIYELLGCDILKLIRTDSEILHSDAYNHVDAVASCQGMSGTPSNHSTFHQRLSYDATSSIGTDSYIVAGLREKKPKLSSIDFNNELDNFVAQLFATYKAQDMLRTILDISANFQGVDNLRLAKSVAKYIRNNESQFNSPAPIKYILYFNEANELCALSLNDNAANPKPIVIGSSSPEVIKDYLDSGPEAYFTIYDQSHTLGIDIEQHQQAKGLAFISRQTKLSDFLQGIMRMRGLIESNQTIDIITPSAFSHLTLEDWLKIMDEEEQLQLKQDNYEAARARMRNIIRNDLLKRILELPDSKNLEEKHRLFQLFKEHFIDKSPDDFFLQYGQINQEEKTEGVLEKFYSYLIADWKYLISKAKIILKPEEKTLLTQQFRKVIEQSSKPGVCYPTQRTTNAQTDIEVQKQVEVETKIEKAIQNATFDPFKTPTGYIYWHKPKLTNTLQKCLNFLPLYSICQTTGATDIPDFHPNIQASVNFYKTYKNQTNYLDAFAKPTYALLFKKDSSGLRCVLLSQQECQELTPLIGSNSDMWITTTQHTLIVGKAPVTIANNPEYRLMIEQVRYFNGEFQLFLTQNQSIEWLSQKTEKKLAFFSRVLHQSRETSTHHLNQIKNLLSEKLKIYCFITKSPHIDRTNFDWTSQFSESSENDIKEFQEVSQACKMLIEKWQAGNFNDIRWLDEINISLIAKSHIHQAYDRLKVINKVVETVSNYTKGNDVIAVLPLIDRLTSRGIKLSELHNFLPNCERLGSDNLPINQQNYILLCGLLRTIPITFEDTRINLINLIVKNGFVETDMIDTLIQCVQQTALEKLIMSASNIKSLLLTIISNQSRNISQTLFTFLWEHVQNEQSLSLYAKHSLLTENKYIMVLKKSKTFPEITNKILLILITRRMSLTTLKELISSVCLEEAHIQAILAKRCDIEIVKSLLNKATNTKDIRMITASQQFKQHADLTIINQLITHDDAEIIINTINHPHTNDETCKTILLREDMHNDKVMLAIIANTSNVEIMLRAWKKSKLNDDLPDLIKNIENKDSLLKIIKNAKPNELLLITKHPKFREYIDTDSFINLITNQRVPSITLNYLKHGIADSSIFKMVIENDELAVLDVLLYIAEHTNDNDILRLIFNKTKDVNIYKTIITNKSTYAQLLHDICRKSHDSNLLTLVLEQNDNLNKDILQTMLHHQYIEPEVLCLLASKTTEPAFLLSISQHPQADTKVLYTTQMHPLSIKKDFDNLLNQFKIKTKLLIAKGSENKLQYNPKYIDVANAAKTLISTLQKAKNDFFKNGLKFTPKMVEQFQAQCRDAISKAIPQFSKHRRIWFQIHPILRRILGIIALLTIIPAIAIAATKHGYVNTFFRTPPTKSLKNLQTFENRISSEVIDKSNEMSEIYSKID